MTGIALMAADTTLTGGVETITTVFGNVWSLITGNPLALAFVGASLLGAALGLFRRLKRSVR
ncbi:MAG: hypothetical protein IJ740_01825 [Ruminococcus sp.]|nr:hypothetical protein [Ruminococcus sp.]